MELSITFMMEPCKAFGEHVNFPVSVTSTHFSDYHSTVPCLAEIKCPTFVSHTNHRQGRTAASDGPNTALGGLVTGRVQGSAQYLPSVGKCRLLPGHLSKSLLAFGRDSPVDKDLSVTP